MKEENTYNEYNGTNLPDDVRMNPFSVPKGYFDGLSASIKARVSEQFLRDSLGEMEEAFTVPADYFEDFAERVNVRIAVERLRDKVVETGFSVPEGYFEESQSSIKAAVFVEDLRDQASQDGFIVPNGYFSELGERSMSIARIVQASKEALVVPDGYFDTLSARIRAKVASNESANSPTPPDTPVVRIPTYKRWAQYAAAAVVLFFVGLGSYWTINNDRTEEQAVQVLALEELSNEEILNYLAQVTEDVELIELATYLPDDRDQDITTYEVDGRVKDQEIEEYLNYML